MLSFIHNESEVITWMGYKLQNQKHKIQSNFLNLKLQIIRLEQGHPGVVR